MGKTATVSRANAPDDLEGLRQVRDDAADLIRRADAELARVRAESPAPCKCQFAPDQFVGGPHAAPSRLPEAVHEMLVTFESRGLAGAIDVVRYLLESVTEDGATVGHLAWMDFPQFVKEHKWENRKAVVAFADSVDGLIRKSIARGEAR